MNTIANKYRNLYNECHKYPKVQLLPNEKAYIIETNPEYLARELVENGFIEKYALDDEDKEKVKTYRMKRY